MNLFSQALNKIFKTGNQKELDRVKPLINEINNQEKNFKNLKNDEFKAKTDLLKFQKVLLWLEKRLSEF